MTILFNKSLSSGIVPQDWRTANVCPIFKKGAKNCPENYRPISLTSQISKLLENFIRDKLIDHLESNSLINQSQHGFRNRHSCLSNLLTFIDHVTKWTDQGNSVDAVFLDFAKAFDKVPHSRLCQKLESHGVTGSHNRWTTNWLSGRKQRVCIDGEFSAWSPVNS